MSKNLQALAREILFQPFDLVDLTQIPDEQLRRTVWSGILELTLKRAARQDLALFVRDIIQHITVIERALEKQRIGHHLNKCYIIIYHLNWRQEQ